MIISTSKSNVDEVNAWLLDVVDSFGFELALENETLGEDCAHIIAEEIAVRGGDSRGAEGYWLSNTEPYRTRKRAKYGVDKPNIRTGQMLSIESLLGQTTVTNDSVIMLYGTGQAPVRSYASNYFNANSDGAITDIEKAYFCSVAHARPFYELDDDIANKVFEHIEATLSEYLARS